MQSKSTPLASEALSAAGEASQPHQKPTEGRNVEKHKEKKKKERRK